MRAAGERQERASSCSERPISSLSGSGKVSRCVGLSTTPKRAVGERKGVGKGGVGVRDRGKMGLFKLTFFLRAPLKERFLAFADVEEPSILTTVNA
jgi:hypothetical protein